MDQEGQAFVHAVIDTAMVVGKFLVAVRDAQVVQTSHKPTCAVEQVKLILRAAVYIKRLQALQIAPERLDCDAGS